MNERRESLGQLYSSDVRRDLISMVGTNCANGSEWEARPPCTEGGRFLLGADAALKIMREVLADNRAIVERFRREARAAGAGRAIEITLQILAPRMAG